MSTRPAGRMRYDQSRTIVLTAGLGILALVALISYMRGVDPKEVTATVLFIPIFVAFVFWRVTGGLVAAIAAVILYTVLRYPDIQAVGADRFLGIIAARSVAFLAFGLLGGWATRQLEKSVSKLELYDQIDDASGLFNARFFIQDTDLEMTRSGRYQTIFSLAVLDIPSGPIESLSRRQKSGLLRELGRMVKDRVRTVDRAVHAEDSSHHRFAIVLPETGAEGAQIFTDRLKVKLDEYLVRRGVSTGDTMRVRSLTFPEDGDAITTLREEFRGIDQSDHPEAPAAAPASARRTD